MSTNSNNPYLEMMLESESKKFKKPADDSKVGESLEDKKTKNKENGKGATKPLVKSPAKAPKNLSQESVNAKKKVVNEDKANMASRLKSTFEDLYNSTINEEFGEDDASNPSDENAFGGPNAGGGPEDDADFGDFGAEDEEGDGVPLPEKIKQIIEDLKDVLAAIGGDEDEDFDHDGVPDDEDPNDVEDQSFNPADDAPVGESLSTGETGALKSGPKYKKQPFDAKGVSVVKRKASSGPSLSNRTGALKNGPKYKKQPMNVNSKVSTPKKNPLES